MYLICHHRFYKQLYSALTGQIALETDIVYPSPAICILAGGGREWTFNIYFSYIADVLINDKTTQLRKISNNKIDQKLLSFRMMQQLSGFINISINGKLFRALAISFRRQHNRSFSLPFFMRVQRIYIYIYIYTVHV